VCIVRNPNWEAPSNLFSSRQSLDLVETTYSMFCALSSYILVIHLDLMRQSLKVIAPSGLRVRLPPRGFHTDYNFIFFNIGGSYSVEMLLFLYLLAILPSSNSLHMTGSSVWINLAVVLTILSSLYPGVFMVSTKLIVHKPFNRKLMVPCIINPQLCITELRTHISHP
jgi:hypothetical protein